jgi:signal transduction histidine kinase
MRDMLTAWADAGRAHGGGRLGTAGWVTWGAISVALTAVSIPTHAALYGVIVPIAFVLGILQGGSVLLAAVRPWWGAAAQLVAVVGIAAASRPAGGPWPMPVVGMIALAAVLVVLGLRGHWRIGAVAWLAGFVLLVSAALVAGTWGAPVEGAVADLIVAASTTALALFAAAVVAQLLQARVEVQEAREQTEVERAHVLWQQERARIAREMHDVVAHSMSIVHMRATSARYRLEGLDADAVAEFDGIAEQARAALREMRGLLGVLREGDGVLDAPQPGLADLPALLDATRDAGVAITASLDGDAGVPEPTASVQLALYRVAQESLSNVVRHAHGAEVFVGLERVGPELWLTVENSAVRDAAGERTAAAPATVPADAGGHGIRGMMERMASVGGSLDHGPIAGGGFRVVARAPHPLPSLDGADGVEGTA